MARKSNKDTEGQETQSPMNKWQSLLNQVSTAGAGGPFFYPKAGKTRIRLVSDPKGDDPDEFFRETVSLRYGKPKTKYVFLGEVLATDNGELGDRYSARVVPIVVSKTVIKSILGLLVEGYVLLSDTEDDEDAHGITIIRSGTGLDTSYTVMPSRKPQGLSENVQWPDESLDDFALMYTENSEQSGSVTSDDDDDDAPTPGSNKPRTSEDW